MKSAKVLSDFGPRHSVFLNEGFSVYNDGQHRGVAELAGQSGISEITAEILATQLTRTSPGEVDYALAGSFVGYLLENYPVEKFAGLWKIGDLSPAGIDAAFRSNYVTSFEDIVLEYMAVAHLLPAGSATK